MYIIKLLAPEWWSGRLADRGYTFTFPSLWVKQQPIVDICDYVDQSSEEKSCHLASPPKWNDDAFFLLMRARRPVSITYVTFLTLYPFSGTVLRLSFFFLFLISMYTTFESICWETGHVNSGERLWRSHQFLFRLREFSTYLIIFCSIVLQQPIVQHEQAGECGAIMFIFPRKWNTTL